MLKKYLYKNTKLLPLNDKNATLQIVISPGSNFLHLSQV